MAVAEPLDERNRKLMFLSGWLRVTADFLPEGSAQMARRLARECRAFGPEAADMLAPLRESGCAVKWEPIQSAPRSDEGPHDPVLILDNGRRYIAEWDQDAGYFQGLYALDGLDEGSEWPRRMYGATAWAALPGRERR